LGGAWTAKVQKVPKLAKYCVKQKKTTAIVGGANTSFALPLDPPLVHTLVVLNLNR